MDKTNKQLAVELTCSLVESCRNEGTRGCMNADQVVQALNLVYDSLASFDRKEDSGE